VLLQPDVHAGVDRLPLHPDARAVLGFQRVARAPHLRLVRLPPGGHRQAGTAESAHSQSGAEVPLWLPILRAIPLALLTCALVSLPRVRVDDLLVCALLLGLPAVGEPLGTLDPHRLIPDAEAEVSGRKPGVENALHGGDAELSTLGFDRTASLITSVVV
jgi:hypothetical protein